MTKEWEEILGERPLTKEFQEGHERARRRFMLGEGLRRWRESRGLSQAQLATILRTSQAAVARMEGGGVEPRLGTLCRLSQALGVEFVVSGEDVEVRRRRMRRGVA